MRYFVSYVSFGEDNKRCYGCLDTEKVKLTTENLEEWFKTLKKEIKRKLEVKGVMLKKIVILNYQEILLK